MRELDFGRRAGRAPFGWIAVRSRCPPDRPRAAPFAGAPRRGLGLPSMTSSPMRRDEPTAMATRNAALDFPPLAPQPRRCPRRGGPPTASPVRKMSPPVRREPLRREEGVVLEEGPTARSGARYCPRPPSGGRRRQGSPGFSRPYREKARATLGRLGPCAHPRDERRGQFPSSVLRQGRGGAPEKHGPIGRCRRAAKPRPRCSAAHPGSERARKLVRRSP